MKPAKYWRQNKHWPKWLGKKGKVIASTLVRVTRPELQPYLPYSFVLVEFGSQRAEFMGADRQAFSPGDEVICVFRKLTEAGKDGLIHYGIKVKNIPRQNKISKKTNS